MKFFFCYILRSGRKWNFVVSINSGPVEWGAGELWENYKMIENSINSFLLINYAVEDTINSNPYESLSQKTSTKNWHAETMFIS